MKTTSSRIAVALLISGIGLVYACTKSGSSASNNNTTTAQSQTQADDDQQVSTESDAVSDDVNTALYSAVTVSGSSAGALGGTAKIGTLGVVRVDSTVRVTDTAYTGLICDGSFHIRDSAGTRTVTLVYSGTNCAGNRTRSGVVIITLPVGAYWRDAGATATVSVQNLKITRAADGKVIVINGTKTITNVSGGLLVDLANLGKITHTVSGNLSVTFPSGKTGVYYEAKKRVFTYDNGIAIGTTGTHTDSLGNGNVANWGTDRFGTGFELLIEQPITFAQSCDFRLVSGEHKLLTALPNVYADITYGLDAAGNPAGCPGTGSYYYKLVVTLGGKNYTYIEPYY